MGKLLRAVGILLLLWTGTLVLHGSLLRQHRRELSHAQAPLLPTTALEERLRIFLLTKDVQSTYSLHTKNTITTPDALITELQQPVWCDLDWSRGGTCGHAKCFFPSTSNATVGYLVGWASLYPQMLQSSRHMHQLMDILGTEYVLEWSGAVPELVDVSAALARRLEQASRQPHPRQTAVFNATTTRQVVVHRVRRLTQPTILIGVSQGKRRHFLDTWPDWIQQQQHANASSSTIAAARHRFSQALIKVQQAFEVFPRLVYDFQGLVDVDGNLYHMDLDRLWEPNVPDEEVEFYQELFNKFMPLLSQIMSRRRAKGSGLLRQRVAR